MSPNHHSPSSITENGKSGTNQNGTTPHGVTPNGTTASEAVPNGTIRNGSANGYIRKSERKPTQKFELQEKKFVLRNSLLTDLIENVPHIAAVQNMFVATIICLFMSIIVNDYLHTGEVTLGIYLIQSGFGKLHIAAIIWICFVMVTILTFFIFNLWAVTRLKLMPKGEFVKIWDRSWMTLLLFFYVSAFRISSMLVDSFELPHACAAIVTLEQCRLIMKIHAFVRHNAEKVVSYKPHSDQQLHWPKFFHFLYFLFAPTFVYRDEYPRTTKIRWDFVVTRFAEIIGVILYQSFIIHRFIIPSYKSFGLRKYTWTEVIAPAVAENSIPGLLILLSGFYQILHSVQNMFAELLMFGDRQFYQDWWTSTSLAEYFRTWNGVVHDWLYTYIYRDIYRLTKGNKTASKLAVFAVSAVVHEWVMTYLFGFFYPVMLYSFLTAAVLSFIRFPKFRFINVMFWYSLAFGSGLICSLYTLEHYARANQPDRDLSSFKYYFVPRWYTCDCIV